MPIIAYGYKINLVPPGSGTPGGGPDPATSPPPEVKAASEIGAAVGFYALEDHTHRSPSIYWPQGAGANDNVVANRANYATKTGAATVGVTNWCTYAPASASLGASANFTTIAGGSENRAAGLYASVVGGSLNLATAAYAFVGGGDQNQATASASVCTGGNLNVASGLESFVGGGRTNTASNDFAVCAGGQANVASAFVSTVCGGQNNRASDNGAAVVGGVSNQATYQNSFIGGGTNNLCNDLAATICGGSGNQSTAPYASIGGGLNNRASAKNASVLGGRESRAESMYSSVPGGYGASAYLSGGYTFASGYTTTRGEAQGMIVVMRGRTPGLGANETVELAKIDTGEPAADQGLALRANTAYTVFLLVTQVQDTTGAARRTDMIHVQVFVDGAGAVTVDGQTTLSTLQVGASALYTITASAGVGPDRLILTFATGAGITQAVDVTCKAIWSERLFA